MNIFDCLHMCDSLPSEHSVSKHVFQILFLPLFVQTSYVWGLSHWVQTSYISGPRVDECIFEIHLVLLYFYYFCGKKHMVFLLIHVCLFLLIAKVFIKWILFDRNIGAGSFIFEYCQSKANNSKMWKMTYKEGTWEVGITPEYPMHHTV